jgi:predicted ATPase
MSLLIHEFTPLWLTIDRIGPFQERMEEIDFTDANNESCNLYLFLSKNGRGKTTALELMAALMGMLGCDDIRQMVERRGSASERPFDLEHLDRGKGRAQWDLRVRYSEDGIERTVVLSLLAGWMSSDLSLRFWDEEALKTVGASGWHRFGFARSDNGIWQSIGKKDAWLESLNGDITNSIGQKVGGIEDSTLVWPTLIYFSAYRNVTPILPSEERSISAPRDWNYRPLHAFRTEGRFWRDSLDNLLVWLKWLDDGRFERALQLVNERVFHETTTFIKDVSREPPEAIVLHDGHRLRLDALSSGEKSLVQLFLRLGTHMTRNTILLIDEPEAHLHDQWKYRLFYQLKALVRDCYPGLTIIVATHSPEIMEAFAVELNEKNLRKGGYFFETPEEEKKKQQIRDEAKNLYGDA